MTTETITAEARRAGDDFLVFGALRASINRIDERLLQLLSERAKIANDIGLAKRIAERPVHDADRERQHAEQLCELGVELGLSAHTVRELYGLLARLGFERQLDAPTVDRKRE
ncbi:MAG: chorismate mutase, partial [Planctomycetes bacterium]|nr:chorismate mutase [Planctomycetota bacterium]